MGGWRQHRADEGRPLSIQEHAMTGIADMNRENHLGEDVATNHEFDDSDGSALCVIENRNCDLENRVVGLSIRHQAAEIIRAGSCAHRFTPPNLIGLLWREEWVGRGDDHALLVGQSDTHIVAGLARPFFEVTDSGRDGRWRVLCSL